MIKRFIISALLLVGLANLAYAGSGTITVLDSAGATKTYDVITDGSGNFLAKIGVCDGTAGAQCVAVKAASTAALATDPALVVAVSPNNTVTVTAASWPLPTGAATSANQATEIASLATIATNTGASIPAGSANIGNVGIFSGGVVSGAAVDGWDATQGSTTDAAATQGSTGTVSAKLRTVTSQLNQLHTDAIAATPAGTNAIGKTWGNYITGQLSVAEFDTSTTGGVAIVTRAVGTIKVYGIVYACTASQTSTSLTGAATAFKLYAVNNFTYPVTTEPLYTTTGTNNLGLTFQTGSCAGQVQYLDN